MNPSGDAADGTIIKQTESVKAPIFIYTKDVGAYKRLLVQLSWKTSADGDFMPMTFVCDTCAPGGLYLCRKAMQLLCESKALVETEEELGFMITKIYCDTADAMTVAVSETPSEPHNIIGLHLLMRLGLKLNACDGTFGFARTVRWLGFA